MAYGCAFLVLNTAAAVLPAWLVVRRFGERPAGLAAGAALGLASSFVFGGCWYVLLPELWSPPRPVGFDRRFWFALSGGFSLAFASAGCAVVAAMAGLGSLARRLARRHAEPGAAADPAGT